MRLLASWLALVLLLSCLLPADASALPSERGGRWYRADAGFHLVAQRALPREGLTPIQSPGRTGGIYVYETELQVESADHYVIDFKNSTTIARFRHFLFAADGQLVAQFSGGIASEQENPFLIRHGRDVLLQPGRYHLISELDSPFLLAIPEPFLQSLGAYRRDIKAGNVLTLGGLGVLLGLGFYYAALALSRRRVADLMYVVFIVGNVLYNGSALLLFSDLFGMHWFYLVSVPILFSNVAYVVFVMALLEIRPREQPALHRFGLAVLALLTGFALAAAVAPNWSLELDRFGVAILTTYGLVAAIVRARRGHSSARWYLIAISAFFMLGGAAISLSSVGVHTLYVEHLGLLAVVVEAALLALVLAQQFSILHTEKAQAERRAREGFRIAHRDALTGLPNRYSLEKALAELPLAGSLTFIDLDGLKYYNDQFGHRKGDELLCSFASALVDRLAEHARLFRLSGDEFAVTCPAGDTAFVAGKIEETIATLRRASFKIAGASFGSVLVSEDPSRESLKHTADTRMYENKRVRRASAPAEWLRDPPVAVPTTTRENLVRLAPQESATSSSRRPSR